MSSPSPVRSYLSPKVYGSEPEIRNDVWRPQRLESGKKSLLLAGGHGFQALEQRIERPAVADFGHEGLHFLP